MSFCPNLNQELWYEGKCHGTFLRKECFGALQRPLDFATILNMWSLARCWEFDSLHHHPQPLPTIGYGFVTTSVLDCQTHSYCKHFLGFISMQIDGAEWPLPLQCFSCVFGSGFNLHGSSLLCWFCEYELFWELQFGKRMNKIKVYTLIDKEHLVQSGHLLCNVFRMYLV